MYHVYLPSFRDANGDGVGDLAGLRERLSYLRDTLGIDALWISPFFVSPWIDGGYDVADHTAIEPRFGDLAMFEAVLADAHRLGMRVIIDFVPNHTSDQHPWFVEARRSTASPKRNWYVWADPRRGERLPNNWLSEAGGSVWEWDEGSRQFYLHSHLVEQPDLNWRNPEVRAAMLNVMRFWLTLGVDGFRIDVAHMLMKDPELRDNPPNPDGGLNPYDRQHPDFQTQLHVYDRKHPDVHGVLRELRAALDEFGDRVAVGELDIMPWREWASYYGADLDELHLPMNFSLIERPWSAKAIGDALEEIERALPAGAWPVNNLGNHDRSRIASRYGEDAARVAAMLLLTMRGTPIVYYGDELGMADVPVPPERQQDGYARAQHGPTRDPNRTPMPWSGADGAGFSVGWSVEPWLPLSPDWRQRNVEALTSDERSVLTLYRRLIELRRSRGSLRRGSFLRLPTGTDDCLLYERRLGEERSLIALNFAETDRVIQLPGAVRVVISTTLARDDQVERSVLALRGNEGAVLAPVDERGARSQRAQS